VKSSSEKNWEAAAKLLKSALNQYRNPTIIAAEAETTDVILTLLQLANGDAEIVAWAKDVTGADAAELRRCCIAYIEREFFAENGDAYCVLGLNPWATAVEVKEHYRLLIRLFHPDRSLVASAAAEKYAARVNQAYAELKGMVGEPAAKLHSSPDAKLHQGQPFYRPSRYRAKSVLMDKTTLRSVDWPVWLTPVKVLLMLALLSTLIITLVFLHKNPVKMSGFEGRADADWRMPAFVGDDGLPVQDSVIAEAEPLPQDNFVTVPDTVLDRTVDTAPLNALNNAASAANKRPGVPVVTFKAQAAPKAPVNVTASHPVLASQESYKPVEMSAATAAGNESSKSADTFNSNVNSQGSQPAKFNATSEQAAPNVESPVEVPSERELRDLIASFMSSYTRGDTRGFMRIFDEQVRSDENGGKAELERTYSKFFTKTVSRTMVLRDLQWKRNGSILIGQADYRATVTLADDGESNLSVGKLRFEVAKSSAGTLVVGFYHEAAKK